MNARPLIPAVFALAASAAAAQGISQLEAGAFGARFDTRYLALGTCFGQEADPNAEEENERETHSTRQYPLFYMISPALAVSAIVPLPYRHSTATEPDGTPVRAAQLGLGDISLSRRPYAARVGHIGRGQRSSLRLAASLKASRSMPLFLIGA